MVTCGVAVSKLLERHGVDVVFGIPGNHTLELYRGLDHSPIRHITSRHEQGAAFMADGYARASGRPGVCFLISGPGLLNAATAIAQARADSVPLLIITAVASRNQQGKSLGQLHELPDQQALARAFCTQSLSLERAQDLPDLLEHAFTAFQSLRPGPIHIQIPQDLMTTPVPLTLLTAANPQPIAAPGTAIPDAFIEVLQQAQRPLLVLGGGALAAEPMILTELAEVLDAPTLQTVNAKGLIANDHDLFVGGSPSLLVLQQALVDADVVLAVGTEFGETDYDLLMGKPLHRQGQLLRIDIDAVQVTRNQIPDQYLVGNARELVPALVTTYRNAHGAPGPRSGLARAAELRRAIQQDPHYHPDMAKFFVLLRQLAPDLVLVGDSCRPTYYASWLYEPTAPRRYFHSVTGFGTLGYAIPAAIGAKLAGEQAVLGLIGDGGAQFTLPELAAAMDYDIAVTIIIWCNRGYEEIENSLRSRGVSNHATNVSSPDFRLIGEAYGMTVYAPRTWQALSDDLRRAITEPQANLVLLQQDDFLQQPSGQWYQ